MNWWVAIPTFTATLAWLSVVVVYWVRAKWWRSTVGINTMGISLFIVLALTRLTYSHLDGVPPAQSSFWLTLFGAFIYTGLTVLGVQRTCLIWDSQKQSSLPLIRFARLMKKEDNA